MMKIILKILAKFNFIPIQTNTTAKYAADISHAVFIVLGHHVYISISREVR